MSLLDGVGNPLSLLSNAAETVCDAVLPKNLEFVGDLVGGAIDIATDNYPKLASDIADFTKDLPQQLGALAANAGLGGAPANDTAATDVSEPPTRSALQADPSAEPTKTDAQASADRQAAEAKQKPAAPTSTPPPAAASAPPATGDKSAGADSDFFGLSDKDLMNAVASGKIPDSVAKDPAEMRELQARIDAITEMNHLLTSMLRALHDMQMTIIQNLRV